MDIKTILHPTDLSEASKAAWRCAADLAHDYGARLIVLHAVETLGPENVTYGEAASEPQPEGYRRRLRQALHQVQPPDPGVPVEYILSEDDPTTAILHVAAERACDLIVLATHGRSGFWRWLEGSVAEQVVRRAPCPVLVTHDAPAPRPAASKVGTDESSLHPHYLSEKRLSEPDA